MALLLDNDITIESILSSPSYRDRRVEVTLLHRAGPEDITVLFAPYGHAFEKETELTAVRYRGEEPSVVRRFWKGTMQEHALPNGNAYRTIEDKGQTTLFPWQYAGTLPIIVLPSNRVEDLDESQNALFGQFEQLRQEVLPVISSVVFPCSPARWLKSYNLASQAKTLLNKLFDEVRQDVAESFIGKNPSTALPDAQIQTITHHNSLGELLTPRPLVDWKRATKIIYELDKPRDFMQYTQEDREDVVAAAASGAMRRALHVTAGACIALGGVAASWGYSADEFLLAGSGAAYALAHLASATYAIRTYGVPASPIGVLRQLYSDRNSTSVGRAA